MSVQQIVLFVGLPGSGKTHLASQFVGPDSDLQDDSWDLPRINQPKVLLIAHPDFIYSADRSAFVNTLTTMYPQAHIAQLFFENSPMKCVRNVRYRNDGRKVGSYIKNAAVKYIIPKSFVPYPIWQPTELAWGLRAECDFTDT